MSANDGDRMKSGTPLVWLSSCRNVTSAQASGSSGRRSPIVSSSASTPSSTSASAVAPLNALDTLAIRMWSSAVGGSSAPTSATPTPNTCRSGPDCTTAIAPGGPPGIATSSRSASSSCARRSMPSPDVRHDMADDDPPSADSAPSATANTAVDTIHPIGRDRAVTTGPRKPRQRCTRSNRTSARPVESIAGCEHVSFMCPSWQHRPSSQLLERARRR